MWRQVGKRWPRMQSGLTGKEPEQPGWQSLGKREADRLASRGAAQHANVTEMASKFAGFSDCAGQAK
eukprot:10184374-Prorocentrum_lima.AAC.1